VLPKRIYEGRGKITLTCDHCSNSYEVFKAHVRSEKHFCSKKCQTAGREKKPKQVVEYQCIECGKVKVVRKGTAGTHTYCSNECRYIGNGKRIAGHNHPCWKGGITERPYLSKKWRAAVITRDQKCVDCDTTDNLTAHHIKPWKDYPELRYDLDNGMTLCRDCHAKKHPELSSIFVKKESTLSMKECLYCNEVFFQKRNKQTFCNKTCSSRYRVKQLKNNKSGNKESMDIFSDKTTWSFY